MESISLYILVFVGGGIGSALRLGANQVSLRLLGPDWPGGTLFVNLVGCFLMGLCAGWFAFRGGGTESQSVRLLITTGIIGGFTTFSAFALDTATLWQRDNGIASAAYVIISVAGSILAAFIGLSVFRGTTP
ncbi:fluoride efflux transporter CrcB [Phyllobacterium myrsinacearum]|uniref:Fluoride-specific ion channel FluC n=1 Tax=Phyllobacterium myrsinacearum TaxID=28101 RepID=A0A2S9JDK9_9HYPH|nr:fluoride efflux transporter CrcB [Phyllobacterium myrsinacearum]PRD50968.1 fluoride efflux transporter CrcB [Phyllobacterium myrsinacearum]PWV88332.1 camphor resistance protein CrcB [Phyllobacterium myrsinacearum]RZS88774.1 camphor resistance protein CrcB [Phyllobacterium myrsinacearum]RZU97623.1 camphor resistance protein CrcB [Phyllobacterium myrsinacearum]